ncbi:EAL domain-containing protein [Roseateles sp. BYS78W]|uniref:EAL domain-containing protein n=1 Tax=Pelomonas candidula TaxID=3299025 RepID=A0ABW7HD65_9BURK
MSIGSATRRAAGVVAGGFVLSALATLWLLRDGLTSAQLGGVLVVHALAALATCAALWAVQRWWLRGGEPLMAQLDAAGQGRIAERAQDGPVEWAPMSRTINVALTRLKAQLDDRDQRLGELHAEISVDPVTGLAARAQFMDKLSLVLHDPDASATGGLVLLRVDDLAGLNQRAGRERADELLKQVATLLRTRALRLDAAGGTVARLNGADFAVLVPRVDADALDSWTRDLAEALHGLKQRELTDRPRVGWLAASVVASGETVGAVMSRVDRGLQAGEGGDTAWQMVRATRSGPTVSLAQWRSLIDEALLTGRVELALAPIRAADGAVTQQLAQVQLENADGRRFGADEVLPAALRTARVADIDLRVAELALARIAGHAEHYEKVAIRISPRSAERPSFVTRLDEALAGVGALAQRLSVEFDIDGERHVVSVLGPLTAVLQRHGVRIGIRRVVAPPEDLALLRRLGVGYLRLGSSLSTGLAGDGSAGKRRLLQLMAELGASEQLRVLAAEAATSADAQLLRSVGIPCADASIEEVRST